MYVAFEDVDGKNAEILISSNPRALTVLSTTNIAAIKVKRNVLLMLFYFCISYLASTDGIRKCTDGTLPLASCS